MKKLFLLPVLFLLLPVVAYAVPVTWDFNGTILQPLQSGVSALIKANRYQATSTTASSIFPLASTTAVTITNHLDVDYLTSAMVITGAGGIFAEYTGTSCTNQFVRSLSVLGAATCASVANTDITDSTILEVDLSIADAAADEDILTSEGTGFEWHSGADLCVAITGHADLCDGTDATGAGGAGTVATSSSETAGYFPVWASTSATPARVAGTSNLFQSGSNVGVGTTTPTWVLNPFSTSASQLALSTGAAISQWAFRNAGGNLYIATTTVGGTATSTLPAISINPNGYVGFGTTTPSYRFDVVLFGAEPYFNIKPLLGTQGATVRMKNDGGQVLFGVESSVAETAMVDSVAYAAFINQQLNLPVQLGTNNTARLTILGDGKVGIGTITPGALLTVNGTASSTAMIVSSAGGTAGCATFSTNGTISNTGTACGSGAGGTFPFSADTNYGQLVYSTSTPTLWFKSGLFASSTSQIQYASTTAVSVTSELDADYLTSALTLTGSTGIFAEYAGTSCTNQFVRSLSALGAATCATVDVSGDTNLTAGDALTLTGDDIDFDGGATPGGSLGGSWASPTIDDLFLLNTGDTATGNYTFDTSTLFIDATGNLVGVGTTTPHGTLAVQGGAGSALPIFNVGSSSMKSYFAVLPTGTTTISGSIAATSSQYIYSTAASKGGSIILEDHDGAGCTEISALNGVLAALTVTCPTEL